MSVPLLGLYVTRSATPSPSRFPKTGALKRPSRVLYVLGVHCGVPGGPIGSIESLLAVIRKRASLVPSRFMSPAEASRMSSDAV